MRRPYDVKWPPERPSFGVLLCPLDLTSIRTLVSPLGLGARGGPSGRCYLANGLDGLRRLCAVAEKQTRGLGAVVLYLDLLWFASLSRCLPLPSARVRKVGRSPRVGAAAPPACGPLPPALVSWRSCRRAGRAAGPCGAGRSLCRTTRGCSEPIAPAGCAACGFLAW